MKGSVFIDGHAGTTGLEIRERLGAEKGVDVLEIAEEERKDAKARARLLNAADVAVLCLPDGAAREATHLIESDKVKVLDTSTAHRTAKGWVYGMPEWKGEQAARIAKASHVSNPGCYAIAAVSVLHPLTEAGVLARDARVCLHAVSGYTGGGREMIAAFEDKSRADYTETPVQAYALGLDQKHVEEIRFYSGLEHAPLFTPLVGRYRRGLLMQAPLPREVLKKGVGIEAVHEIVSAFYAKHERIEVAPPLESSARLDADALAGEDGMCIYISGHEDRGDVLLSALSDNLGKGAAGTAMQNLRLMLER